MQLQQMILQKSEKKPQVGIIAITDCLEDLPHRVAQQDHTGGPHTITNTGCDLCSVRCILTTFLSLVKGVVNMLRLNSTGWNGDAQKFERFQ